MIFVRPYVRLILSQESSKCVCNVSIMVNMVSMIAVSPRNCHSSLIFGGWHGIKCILTFRQG